MADVDEPVVSGDLPSPPKGTGGVGQASDLHIRNTQASELQKYRTPAG